MGLCGVWSRKYVVRLPCMTRIEETHVVVTYIQTPSFHFVDYGAISTKFANDAFAGFTRSETLKDYEKLAWNSAFRMNKIVTEPRKEWYGTMKEDYCAQSSIVKKISNDAWMRYCPAKTYGESWYREVEGVGWMAINSDCTQLCVACDRFAGFVSIEDGLPKFEIDMNAKPTLQEECIHKGWTILE